METRKTTRKRSLEGLPNTAPDGAEAPAEASKPKRKATGRLMTPRELQALLMRGAQAGAETLVDLLEEGKITSRDLAVVTGILVDKIAKLAPLAKRDDDDVMTPEALEHELKRQAALAAELKRREDLEAAAKATPPEELRDESPAPSKAALPSTVAPATPSPAPVPSPQRPVEVRTHRPFGNANR